MATGESDRYCFRAEATVPWHRRRLRADTKSHSLRHSIRSGVLWLAPLSLSYHSSFIIYHHTSLVFIRKHRNCKVDVANQVTSDLCCRNRHQALEPQSRRLKVTASIANRTSNCMFEIIVRQFLRRHRWRCWYGYLALLITTTPCHC